MVLIFEIIGILLLVILIAFLINTIEDYHKRIIPFLEFKKVEYPIVTFYQNGKPFNFLIDSGSNMSFITNKTFNSMEYEPANYTMNVEGVDNISETVEFYNIRFNFKDKIFVNAFGLKDIDFSIIKQNTGYNIDGIIGSLFLDKYGMMLDFENHRLQITK